MPNILVNIFSGVKGPGNFQDAVASGEPGSFHEVDKKSYVKGKFYMEHTEQFEQFPAVMVPVGFQMKLEVIYFRIHGMNCPRCAERVRLALLNTPGASNVIIEFPDGLAEVTYNPEAVTVDELISAVQAAGDGGHHQYLAQWIE